MIGNPYEREQKALIDFSLMKPWRPGSRSEVSLSGACGQ
jgi:hypothetical protein